MTATDSAPWVPIHSMNTKANLHCFVLKGMSA